MGITLIKVLLKKEGVHWRRMGEMFSITKQIGGKLFAYPLLVTIISIFHYAFAGMSALFEISLWMFNTKQFKQNMVNINAKMEYESKLKLS